MISMFNVGDIFLTPSTAICEITGKKASILKITRSGTIGGTYQTCLSDCPFNSPQAYTCGYNHSPEAEKYRATNVKFQI